MPRPALVPFGRPSYLLTKSLPPGVHEGGARISRQTRLTQVMHSEARAPRPPILLYLSKGIGLCGVYLGAALLGLHFASVGRSISLVWPPTGLAIAALTLWGFRYWPSVAVGAFLANALTAIPLGAAAAIAAGNTLEALVASYLLARFAGSRPDLDDIRQVRVFAGLAAPAGALCSADHRPQIVRVFNSVDNYDQRMFSAFAFNYVFQFVVLLG